MAHEREPYKGAQEDKVIIQAIKDGKDDQVLSVLYNKVYAKVKNLVLKNSGTTEEAEDVFQDAVIIFYRYVKTGRFKEENDIDGFIYGVSKNLFAKVVQKKKKKQSLEYVEALPDNDHDVLDEMISKEKETIIQNLMEQLGERCKEMLTHAVFYKLSMKEISEKMGFANENAAKTANYKCKQRLIKMVQDNPSLIEILKK